MPWATPASDRFMTVGASVPTPHVAEPALRASHQRATRSTGPRKRIGNEGQENVHEQRFDWEEGLAGYVLIDRIERDRDQDDLACCFQSFVEPIATLLRIGQDRPEIGRSPGAGIPDAIPNGKDGRHDRLQEESQGQGTARAVDQVGPDTLKLGPGDSVQDDSGNDKYGCHTKE
jgi:hypothetical protein